jgi:hypothetical protein
MANRIPRYLASDIWIVVDNDVAQANPTMSIRKQTGKFRIDSPGLIKCLSNDDELMMCCSPEPVVLMKGLLRRMLCVALNQAGGRQSLTQPLFCFRSHKVVPPYD